MRVDGKVVIITGGAQGLGKAFAIELLKNKAKVCICDVNHQNGEKTRRELAARYGDHVMFLKCDVTNHDNFEDVFNGVISRYGGIDVLVNNAGVDREGPNWRTSIFINLIGVIEGTKLAEQYMCKQNGGRGGVVINIGSTAGLSPTYIIPVYVASKHGVVGYTRSIAKNPNIASTGMSYACLCPGSTATSMYNKAFHRIADLYGKHKATSLIEPTGVNTVDSLVGAFMQLLTKDNNNGVVVTVTQKQGIKYRYGLPQNKL